MQCSARMLRMVCDVCGHLCETQLPHAVHQISEQIK